MKRLVGYARVSTDIQNVNSLDDQTKRIAAQCVVSGCELVHVYHDVQSGSTANREGLQKALELVFSDQADGIIVCYLDRLARNIRDLLDVVDRLEKADKTLVALDLSLDTSTPMGHCMLTVFGAMAQFQREQTRERSARGRERLKAAGKHYSGEPPYGWASTQTTVNGVRKSCNTLVPVDTEQAIIQRVGNMYQSGMGVTTIATELNNAGYQTRYGCAWTYKQVQRILSRQDVA